MKVRLPGSDIQQGIQAHSLEPLSQRSPKDDLNCNNKRNYAFMKGPR